MINFSYKKAVALCIVWSIPNFSLLVLSPHPFGQFSRYAGRDYGSFYPFISSKDYNGEDSGIFPNRIEQYDFTEFLVYTLVPLALLLAVRLWFLSESRSLADLKLNASSNARSSESAEPKKSVDATTIRKSGFSWRSLIKVAFYLLIIIVSIGWAILAKMIRDEERERARQKAWFESGLGRFPAAPLPEYKPLDISSVVLPVSVAGLELYSPAEIRRVEAEIPEDRRDNISELERYQGEFEDAHFVVSRYRFIANVSDGDSVLSAEVERGVERFKSWVEAEEIVSEVENCNIDGVSGKLCRLAAVSRGIPVKYYFLILLRDQICWHVGVSCVNAEDDLMMERALKSVKVGRS